VLRWNGFTNQASPAGVPAPSKLPTMTFSGTGPIVGAYRCFLRYIDANDYPGNLTPIAPADVIALSRSGVVAKAVAGTPIVLTITAHGFNNSTTIKTTGIAGIVEANGVFKVTVIDANNISLNGSTADGLSEFYGGGGTWIAGTGLVTYGNLEAPADPRVVRRQILRNTDGQEAVFYVDIDTTDLSSATLTSTQDDNALQTGIAVPFLDSTGKDVSNVNGEPPNNKPLIVYHRGLVFMAGDVRYTEGAVALTFGSNQVHGIATEWRAAAAGRFIYVVGANKAYTIAAVDELNQIVTLTEPYLAPSQPYAFYAICSAEPDQRTVYYSDASHAEGFSPLVGFTIASDGDDFTGELSYDSFLYILERSHIYKQTYQTDPNTDGAVYQSSDRGCVNQRCAVKAGESVYMLDEKGIHAFGGRNAGDRSDPVQTLFRPDVPGPKINFAAGRFFHGVLDQTTEVIRWFVSLSGTYLPRHAICYQYDLDRWWIEEYPWPISCSFVGRLYRRAPLETWGAGRLQVFLGSTGRRVFAVGASPLDGVPPLKEYACPITTAGFNWLETPSALPPCVNAPVVIVGGRGKGQRRIVVSMSGTRLRLRDPWLVQPDVTSTIQVGGIEWSWKSGWMEWADEETTNPRAVEVSFGPTTVPSDVTLNRFRDRSDQADVIALDRAEDGVLARAGESDVLLSLEQLPGGFGQALMFSGKQSYTRGPQVISVGLNGVGTIDPVKLYQIDVDGVVDPTGIIPDRQLRRQGEGGGGG
jgi:hypothetical protein